MYLFKKTFSIKYFYTLALMVFVIFSGSFSIIGSLRFIEVLVPIFALFMIFLNRYIVPFGSISRTYLIFLALILVFGLYQFDNNSLFAIRLANSLIACATLYYLATRDEFFVMYPQYLLIASSFLYFVGIYTYFWEYTYIFSLLLAPLIYYRKLLFALLDIALLLSIGQRTSILNIGYIIFNVFFYGKLNLSRSIYIIVIISLIFLSFTYLDIRALNAYKDLSFSEIYSAIASAIDIAGSYSYEEFVYGDARYDVSEGEDLSLSWRLRKWGHAVASSNLYSLFFGLGPGYFGRAADSGWIRLFFEYGIIIFSIFLSLVFKIYKAANPLQRLIIGIFFISNIFLDILYSPLLMGFTGLLLGLSSLKNYELRT